MTVFLSSHYIVSLMHTDTKINKRWLFYMIPIGLKI